MIHSKQEIEIAQKIGQFFLKKNNDNYAKTSQEIQNLRIVRIEIIGKTKLLIETSRPGLLIGLKGEQIHQLMDFIGMEIHIIESQCDLLEHMIPHPPIEHDYQYEDEYEDDMSWVDLPYRKLCDDLND